MKTILTCVFVLLLFAFDIGRADLIYDNGDPAGDSNRCATSSLVSGPCEGAWVVFDDFLIASNTSIASIEYTAHIWGGLGDFVGATLFLYNADPVFGGGDLLFSTDQISSLSENPDLDLIRGLFVNIAFSSLNFVLAPGSYWLGFQFDTVSDFATVACTADCFSGNATQWLDEGAGTRNSARVNLSFEIRGNLTDAEPDFFPKDPTIPIPIQEPGILALFTIGLAGIGLARRRNTQ